MIEVLCSDCGKHICWMIDSGPTGLFYCNDCYIWYEEGEDGN